MHFRCNLFLYAVLCFTLPFRAECGDAALIDRLVASVDDQAITKSELDKKYQELKQINRAITYRETLQGMINRTLLLKDAHKLRMKGDEKEIIQKYIDLKIRALIRINEKDVMKYYDEHREEFKGQAYREVYDDIMNYLTELEVNERLKKHIDQLRADALILMYLDSEQ